MDKCVIEELRVFERFKYVDGILYRKELPRDLFINDRAWKIFNTRFSGNKTGRLASGYLYVSIKKKNYAVHRIIFFMFHGYVPKIVDHVDGNTLNNKIDNLREATQSQNQANSRLSKSNTSGYKGVYFHKPTGMWQASIKKAGKLIHLGLFKDINEAISVRRNYFEELNGEFARHE